WIPEEFVAALDRVPSGDLFYGPPVRRYDCSLDKNLAVAVVEEHRGNKINLIVPHLIRLFDTPQALEAELDRGNDFGIAELHRWCRRNVFDCHGRRDSPFPTSEAVDLNRHVVRDASRRWLNRRKLCEIDREVARTPRKRDR